MKKLFFTVLLFVGFIGFSQNGINYKAVIKDGAGAIIVNQLVVVEFSILDGATNVYQENHTPTTNTDGLIILNIGEGTPLSGSFSGIDWSSNNHFLNVQVNTGGGLQDLGTTPFKTVPYAKLAETSIFATTSGDTRWIDGTTINDITNNNTGTVEIAGALQVQGTAGIDEFSVDGTLADNSDNALPTEQAVKTYVDSNLATGLEALDEGIGIGWRLKGRDPANYANIGADAVDISSSFLSSTVNGATGSRSFAAGLETIASAPRSVAMGTLTEASGFSSFSMGSATKALGFASFATGRITQAIGNHSASFGHYSEAIGNSSMAMGNRTNAPSFAETVIGSYNTLYTPIDGISWDPTDRLFVVGNGTNTSNRSDAFTVLKNGKLYLTPTHDDAALTDASGYLIIGQESGANIVFDNNEMMARDNAATSPLYLQRDGGNVSIGNVGTPNVELDIQGSIQYTGTITDVSDRRLKEKFESISSPLEKLHNITGYSYNMIDDKEKIREYGVIAQDVQKVFPEMVSVVDTENGYLGVSYTQLIPVLLEAIKEQQLIISSEKSKVSKLEAQIEAFTAADQQLFKLVTSLQNQMNNQKTVRTDLNK